MIKPPFCHITITYTSVSQYNSDPSCCFCNVASQEDIFRSFFYPFLPPKISVGRTTVGAKGLPQGSAPYTERLDTTVLDTGTIPGATSIVRLQRQRVIRYSSPRPDGGRCVMTNYLTRRAWVRAGGGWGQSWAGLGWTTQHYARKDQLSPLAD